MWVDAPARRALAPITPLGHRVGITLTLARVDYRFGDGTAETGAEPGTPYDEQRAPCHTPQCPAYFGHTYRVTGRMTITATAAWTATFTVDGGNPVAIPGTLTGPQASATILVRQARGVLVPN